MSATHRGLTPTALSRRWGWLAGYAAAAAAGTLWARRHGYGIGGTTLVRCRDGHLFTTWWLPGASIKALRLGWWRYQHCPVGQHWSLIAPVRAADLSADDLVFARAHHDRRLP